MVDTETGEVLARQERKLRLRGGVLPPGGLRGGKTRKCEREPAPHKWIRDAKNNLVWVPIDVHADALIIKHPFHEPTWDYICHEVARGRTLKDLAQEPGVPPIHILYKWSRGQGKEAWQDARRARAEWAQDTVIDIVTGPAIDKDEAAGARVKLDAAKWVAETGDRDTYGKSTKVTGEMNVAHTIIIDTGISREGPESALSTPPPALTTTSRPVSSPSGLIEEAVVAVAAEEVNTQEQQEGFAAPEEVPTTERESTEPSGAAG